MDPTEAEDIKSRWQTQILNDTIDQLDLIDIYRTFHPKTMNFTFFSSAHGTFSTLWSQSGVTLMMAPWSEAVISTLRRSPGSCTA